LLARHAAQVAASLGRSEKLVQRSIALDEALVNSILHSTYAVVRVRTALATHPFRRLGIGA